MAFRKRNVGISRSIPGLGSASSSLTAPSASPAPLPGVRPSPIDGRPTTSTGTPSFDGILAGHAGFALGSSILIEESGTTDFAGALLRYYAAEGVIQGHKVHVIGVGEQWGRELPGLVGVSGSGTDDDGSGKEKKERMKIAWRYERLGEFGSGISGSRGVWDESPVYISQCKILFSNSKILFSRADLPPKELQHRQIEHNLWQKRQLNCQALLNQQRFAIFSTSQKGSLSRLAHP